MVNQNRQLEFFAEPSGEDQVIAQEPDYEAIAAAGDRRNATYDPNERAAQNRRGSGGGFAAAVAGEIEVEPVEVPPKATTPRTKKQADRRKLSSRGRLIADREPDTAHDPAYQPPVELDEKTREIGRRGVAQVREILAARNRDEKK